MIMRKMYVCIEYLEIQGLLGEGEGENELLNVLDSPEYLEVCTTEKVYVFNQACLLIGEDEYTYDLEQVI